MSKFLQDYYGRIINAEAKKLVHCKFSSQNWEYCGPSGYNNRSGCTMELVENGEFLNNKIEGYIKGTYSPKLMKDGKKYALEIDIKNINYGLGSSCAFVIFYVDVINKIVYYLPLQDYFISKPELFDRLEKNKSTMTVHIPCDNIVCEDDYDLQQIAKSVYVNGPSRNLRKA